jgi:hypothetical protein
MGETDHAAAQCPGIDPVSATGLRRLDNRVLALLELMNRALRVDRIDETLHDDPPRSDRRSATR